MLTNLKSLLIENGYFGNWENLKFKVYNKDDGGDFFAAVSEWRQFFEDDANKLLTLVFDTNKPHPSVYMVYADCGDKKITLSTKVGSTCMKVNIVYGTEEQIKMDLDVTRFGTMPGCHV